MPVILRPWHREDTPCLLEALNTPLVLDNLRDGLPSPYTEADALEYIEAMQSADPYSTFARAITAEGRAIGSIGIFRQPNIHCRTAEMGYYLAPAHWGRGYATKAVQLACEEVFAHTDILRIFAQPFSRNTASCRVLEKAGFTLEGTLRANAFKNNHICDMNLYALVKE